MSTTEVYVFSSFASYGLHRLMIKYAVAHGRNVIALYAGTNNQDYAAIKNDIAEFNLKIMFFERLVEAQSIEFSIWDEFPKVVPSHLIKLISLLFLRNPIKAFTLRQVFKQRKRAARKILSENNISAVICSEDGISGELAFFVVAKELGIPVIDVPYGNATEYDFDVALKQREKEGSIIQPAGWILFLLGIFASKWLKKTTYPNALLLEPEHVMALESLGISLDNAWIVHGGKSDILCAENKVAVCQYLREGILEDKIRETGSPYCDVLTEALCDREDSGERFFTSEKIEPHVTWVLVSWPPSYHETYPGTNEFGSYLDMTRRIFEFLLLLPNVKLTVSLHPACDDDVLVLLSDLGVNVSEEYVVSLIAKHDVFTTYFSSTIRWALSCGIPVINYDAYHLNLSTYDTAPGFLNAKNFEQYCQMFMDITSNDEMYVDLSKKQIANAPEWGGLDGKNTKRVFEEVDRLELERKRR